MTFTKTSTALALLLSLPLAAHAADPEAPGFLSELPLVPAGNVAGMKAWSLEGDEALWMLLPDGKTVVAGYAFDIEGNDIGSPALGATPVDAWESAGVERPVVEDEKAGMSLVPAPAGPLEDAEAEAAFNDIMAQTEAVLAKIPEEEQRRQMVELVAAMDNAKTPAEFQLALVEWSERVGGKAILSEGDRELLKDAAATEAAALAASPDSAPSPAPAPAAAPESITPDAADPAAPVAPANLPNITGAIEGEVELVPASAEIGEGDADEAAEMAALYAQIETDSLWFSLGNPGAPMAYMFADPMCKWCAKSIRNLKGDIEAGQLQLRVILVPLISSRSPGAIAGIMSTENPAEAFWDHELDYDYKGASDLKHVDFSTLPASVSASIKKNYDLIVDNGLPGVPFFAWQDQDGPSFYAGTPEAGHFSTALPAKK